MTALAERPIRILKPNFVVPSGVRLEGDRWSFPDGRTIAADLCRHTDLFDPQRNKRLVPEISGGALGTHPYVFGYLNAYAKKINFTSDAIKVGLATSLYTPSQAHEWYSDITNEVANANGYTTGGVALGSATNVVAGSTQTLSGANVTWTSSGSGFSAAFAFGYDSTPGTAGTDPLIWYVDLGGTQTVAGGATLTVTWNASGIIAATVS